MRNFTLGCAIKLQRSSALPTENQYGARQSLSSKCAPSRVASNDAQQICQAIVDPANDTPILVKC